MFRLIELSKHSEQDFLIPSWIFTDLQTKAFTFEGRPNTGERSPPLARHPRASARCIFPMTWMSFTDPRLCALVAMVRRISWKFSFVLHPHLSLLRLDLEVFPLCQVIKQGTHGVFRIACEGVFNMKDRIAKVSTYNYPL